MKYKKFMSKVILMGCFLLIFGFGLKLITKADIVEKTMGINFMLAGFIYTGIMFIIAPSVKNFLFPKENYGWAINLSLVLSVVCIVVNIFLIMFLPRTGIFSFSFSVFGIASLTILSALLMYYTDTSIRDFPDK
jgi:hypothetical protein